MIKRIKIKWKEEWHIFKLQRKEKKIVKWKKSAIHIFCFQHKLFMLWENGINKIKIKKKLIILWSIKN